MINISIGNTIDITIEKLTYTGDGLGRWQNIAVFVPRVAPEDVVSVKITQVKKSYLRAEVIKFLRKSPHRITLPCPFFSKGCGGCQWMHIDYNEQLRIKQKMVVEAVDRAKLGNIAIYPVIGMKTPYFYRNKATAHYHRHKNKVDMGFYKHRSNQIIDIFGRENGECKVQSIINNNVLSAIGKALMTSIKGVKKSGKIALRSGSLEETKSISLSLPPGLHINNDSIQTSSYIEIKIEPYIFQVSGPSFFQINLSQTEKMVKVVKNYLNKVDKLVDLYSGVGLFAISCADKADHIWAIESAPTAIKDARRNQSLNQISNIQWLEGTAETAFPQLIKTESHIDAVILDPPREGCDRQLLQALIKITPAQIIYISCDLATLCRDLKILQDAGFKIKEIQPIDMFPHTYHIECIAHLTL